MAGTLVEGGREGWVETISAFSSTYGSYTLCLEARGGLNTEQRILGLRDCHRHTAPQFSFEDGNSALI